VFVQRAWQALHGWQGSAGYAGAGGAAALLVLRRGKIARRIGRGAVGERGEGARGLRAVFWKG